mgnify:CR=1 FL=1
MKKLSAAFITIALIFSLTICTAAQADLPSPTSEFFVNDFAGVLSNSAEETINHMGKALEDMTGAQVVVVTVQSLDGQDIDSYANELFRKWGIGEKDRNNGVLILNSVSDRMLRIEVGYGLEGALTDIETAEIRTEYMNPYLKEGNYDSGILNGYTAVVNAVCEEYGIDMDDLLPKCLRTACRIMIITGSSGKIGTVRNMRPGYLSLYLPFLHFWPLMDCVSGSGLLVFC